MTDMSETSAGEHSLPLDAPKTYRMTRPEREQLRKDALALGMTDQQYFEYKMFGEAKPVRKPGARRKYPSSEQFAMTA